MLGDLSKREIIDFIEKQSIGRLGCHAENETYIVPINYISRENIIYAHSGPGKKIDMMRKNPNVCFQIDDIKDTFRWKSVIVWGTYEELHGLERQQVMQGLLQKIMSVTDEHAKQPSHAIDPSHYDNLIVYKISIIEGTGKFESHQG